MADVFTADKRSQVMSRIRSEGNKATELSLIRVFRAHHITGWRRHQTLFGRPDFVFYRQRVAVFVDGCFWHGCPLHQAAPRTNGDFWARKLAANKARDRLVARTLKSQGWRVLRIWEHDLTARAQAGTARRCRRVLGFGP